MNTTGWLQILLYFAVVLLLVKAARRVQWARVYEGKRNLWSQPCFGSDGTFYVIGSPGWILKTEMGLEAIRRPQSGLSARSASCSFYLLQRIQGWLPGGPAGVGNVSARPFFQHRRQFRDQPPTGRPTPVSPP